MTTSVIEISEPKAEAVKITGDTLSVDLNDGRTISVTLEWFPRLCHLTRAELNNWRLIGRGHGIHWEDIDEDISVEGLYWADLPGKVRSLSKNGSFRERQKRVQSRENRN